MRFAILDSNVYIDIWSGKKPLALLDGLRASFVVRYSSVVLSELRRGAATPAARRLVEGLRRIATPPCGVAPLAAEWWAAGGWIQKLGDRNGWEAAKRRALQNDVLIALTAKAHGWTVVTCNRDDFELLAKHINVSLLFV